jgi:hypothetical protein
MRPASCKAKGRRLQQAIVRDILQRFPQLTADDCRSTSMGAGGEDVLLSPAARRVVPLSIEAKNQERLNIWASLDQAARNAGGRDVCVVFKKNHGAVFAAVPWQTLLDLLELRAAALDDAGAGPRAAAPAPATAAPAPAPVTPDACPPAADEGACAEMHDDSTGASEGASEALWAACEEHRRSLECFMARLASRGCSATS